MADGTPKGMALLMGGAGIGCLVAALGSHSARKPHYLDLVRPNQLPVRWGGC